MDPLTQKKDVPNERGIPHCSFNRNKGGILSPLLCNVALHGMINDLEGWYAKQTPTPLTYHHNGRTIHRKPKITLIRYADNFVVIHPDKFIIEGAKIRIATFLAKGPKLEFSEAKTSVRSSAQGFTFLGFSVITVRRFGTSRCKIYPAKKSKDRITAHVREVIQKGKAYSAYQLISTLNPKLIGWGQYFRFSECTHAFRKADYSIWEKVRSWVFRRDHKHGRYHMKQKYFPSDNEYKFEGRAYRNNWILNGSTKGKNGGKLTNNLIKLSWITSKQHIKIKDDASPFDGNDMYWSQRTKSKGLWTPRQKMLHRHCHVQKTSKERKLLANTKRNG